MLKKFSLFLLCFIILFVSVGCQNEVAPPTTFSSAELFPLMGKNKVDVIKSLNLNESDAKITKSGDQEDWLIKTDSSDKINITFYNNVFMAYRFLFNDLEAAYNFAVKDRETVGQALGAPTTYPGYSNSSARFDKIVDFYSIKNNKIPMEYFEDWTPKTDVEQMKKMLDDKDFSRVDIRFSFSALAENIGTVHVRYVAVP